MMIRTMIIRPLVLIAAFALPFVCAAQSEADYGTGQDVLGLFDSVMSDPSDYASDVDSEFEADEVLAINISSAALELANTLGFSLLDSTPLPGLGFKVTRLRLPDGFIDPVALLRTLVRADPLGLYGRNSVYRLADGSDVGIAANGACEGTRCYGQALVGWPAGGCTHAARIGMLDSAVDVGHPALKKQKLVQQRIGRGKARAAEQEHGTAVAALLIGSSSGGVTGLLPQASLYAADVFELDPDSRPYTDAYKLIQGLDWLARQKLDALNISIAGPASPILHKAVQVLDTQGVAIAAAAGNLGPKAPPQYPAAYPEVLAVAAIDRQMKPYAKGNQGKYVGIAAPGIAIWTATAKGGARFLDGSSYAAPYAAASLALLRRDPTERGNVKAAIQQLRSAARDLGAKGVDPVFGAGLLQLPAGACAGSLR